MVTLPREVKAREAAETEMELAVSLEGTGEKGPAKGIICRASRRGRWRGRREPRS